MNKDFAVERERKVLYREESRDFGSRETGLAGVFFLPRDKVFQAVDQAVRRQGLKPVMVSRKYGLLIAKPRFSLLNAGRKVTISFSRTASGHTLVRARYTHGLLSFQGKLERLEILESVFRWAVILLDTVADAKSIVQSASRKTVAAKEAEVQAAGLQERARTTGPGQDVAGRGLAGMNGLDFGSLDWNEIPLQRPSPRDFWKYRGIGNRASARSLPLKWKLFWFGLGVVLVLLTFAAVLLLDR